jgi:hypothetical protein
VLGGSAFDDCFHQRRATSAVTISSSAEFPQAVAGSSRFFFLPA